MPNLPFVVDNRKTLAGRPVVHALVIGVDTYSDGSLKTLSAGAHTAARMCEWLLEKDRSNELPAPLSTLTFLASPRSSQRAVISGLVGDQWTSATHENVVEALDRLKGLIEQTERELQTPDVDIGAGLAFYYFGGHGADLFRHDPIGFLADADLDVAPWAGAIDHQEEREQLCMIENPAPATMDWMRCLFLYDCCRTRDADDVPALVLKRRHSPILRAKTTRPYAAFNATQVTFSAWEPTAPVNLPPICELPLSYFGHAWLNVAEWSVDAANNVAFPWQTTTGGIANFFPRAMAELSRRGGTILEAPEFLQGDEFFPVRKARIQTEVELEVHCEPETEAKTTTVEIFHCVPGRDLGPIRVISTPWERHPDLSRYPPVVLKFVASNGASIVDRTINLAPSLTPWRCIVANGIPSFRDPRK